MNNSCRLCCAVLGVVVRKLSSNKTVFNNVPAAGRGSVRVIAPLLAGQWVVGVWWRAAPPAATHCHKLGRHSGGFWGFQKPWFLKLGQLYYVEIWGEVTHDIWTERRSVAHQHQTAHPSQCTAVFCGSAHLQSCSQNCSHAEIFFSRLHTWSKTLTKICYSNDIETSGTRFR